MAVRRTSARASGHSQSLERGLAILSAFKSRRPLLGVSDLARDVGLSRSTTHRYIATLTALGHLDPTQVLARGYSIVRDASGHVRVTSAGLSPGDELDVMFSQGGAGVRVDKPR